VQAAISVFLPSHSLLFSGLRLDDSARLAETEHVKTRSSQRKGDPRRSSSLILVLVKSTPTVHVLLIPAVSSRTRLIGGLSVNSAAFRIRMGTHACASVFSPTEWMMDQLSMNTAWRERLKDATETFDEHRVSARRLARGIAVSFMYGDGPKLRCRVRVHRNTGNPVNEGFVDSHKAFA
jgi:hypothetical protein